MDINVKTAFPWTKIILLAHDFKPVIGGVSEYSFQLARQLKQLGLLDFVATSHRSSEEIPIRRIWTKKHRSNEWWLEDSFITVKRMYNGFFKLKSMFTSYLDCRMLNSSQDRLVLITSYYFDPGSRLIVYWLRKMGIPYAIVFHGLDILQHFEYRSPNFSDDVQKAQFLIFNSKATKGLFIKTFPSLQQKSIILNSGIDPDGLAALKTIALSEFGKNLKLPLTNGPIVSCVAHLVKRKGLDIAIEAMKSVKQRFPEVMLLIGGDGPERENLSVLISEAGLTKNVHLLGRLDELQKVSLLTHSKIFVTPTRSLGGTDFEGFGISFLEASYFGNVVIGGKHGGVPEAIEDQVSGFTLDFDALEASTVLGELLVKLFSEEDLLSQIISNGQKRVVEKFNWKHLAKEGIDNINRLSA